MTKTERTTISITKPRFEQLVAIAKHRGLPNAAALIDNLINDAITAGEIPPELPGLSCQRHGDGLLITVKETALPSISAQKARTLAAILSAACGESDPVFSFTMTPAKPVWLDLGDHVLIIARAGQAGVRLVCRPKAGGDSTLSSISPSFAIELARQIREAFGED